jgi:protein disulfide-isomerase-like protein
MKSWATLLLVLLISLGVPNRCFAEDVKGSEVRVLTDDNFEHDTQASTGGTTGPWLVEFYAPWCGHCQKLAPVWEQLAIDLNGQINVAKLDCTENSYTAKRFDIRGFPTIKLLRQGKVYEFEGTRTLKDISEWATAGYSNAPGKSMPQPFSFWEMLMDQLRQTANDVKLMVARKPEASGVIFIIGMLVGLVIVLGIQLAFPDLRMDRPLSMIITSPRPGQETGTSTSSVISPSTPLTPADSSLLSSLTSPNNSAAGLVSNMNRQQQQSNTSPNSSGLQPSSSNAKNKASVKQKKDA